MSGRTPHVSVLMPTWNQDFFLERALRSIERQVYRDFELIVVDDGSTDRTRDILTRSIGGLDVPSARTITHEANLGTAAAINTGFDASRGRLVTWVSSDNEMTPDWLLQLATAMKDSAGAAYAAYLRVAFNPATGREADGGEPYYREYSGSLLISGTECHYGPAFLIRRDVWERAGPHRGRTNHDYDHWLRVEEACEDLQMPILSLNRVLCRYMVHPLRQCVVRAHDSDATLWRKQAIERRNAKRMKA